MSGIWVNDTSVGGNPIQSAAFINGGSVSISTVAAAFRNNIDDTDNVDVTQSIVLAPGSVIDASGGGYVSPNGKFTGGNGGSVSLLTYTGQWAAPNADRGNGAAPVYYQAPSGGNQPTNANVFMNGAIYADGFGGGGTFTLQAPTITIDGAATGVTSSTAGANAGEIVLPTSFFTGSGFSNYVLTSTYGSTTVTAGTQLLLQQSNYLPGSALLALPTGAVLRDSAAIGLLPDGVRNPVSLTLAQRGYIYDTTGGPSTTAGVLIDQSASIVAEANASKQASITLNADGPVTVLGTIRAPGGNITLSAATNTLTSGVAAGDVWIGANAVLDVSGTYVQNPAINSYQTGSVLNGGTISLSGPSILALPGSSFLLNGTSAQIQNPTGSVSSGQHFVNQQIWSDGGTLALTGVNGGIYFAGNVDANGGAPLASGGTLIVKDGSIVIEPAGLVATALAGATAYPLTPTALTNLLPYKLGSNAFIGADTLNQSGFESVSLNAANIAFNGSLSISLPGSLVLNGNLMLLPSTTTLLPSTATNTTTGQTSPLNYSAPSCSVPNCIPTIGGTTVNLAAGYVSLSGSAASFQAPTFADGTLNVTAQWIDLGSPTAGSLISLDNVSSATFTSSDAVRLIGLSTSSTSNAFQGGLYAAGNLTLNAAEIYPASGTSFVLASTGTAAGANTLTINQTGTASQPISAGGTLILDAVNIAQNGTLWAPFGQIVIGLNSSSPSTVTSQVQSGFVTTQNVTLGAGSLTSVSGDGSLIPFGYTVDAATWFVGNTFVSGGTSIVQGTNVTASPAKAIALSGTNVTTASGAVLDLSGGGDIYATEFVSGTGGTQNVLSGSNVYALVPTSSAKVAAYDPTFANA